MANSTNFNIELFTREEYFEEAPLRDRKLIVRLWQPKGKREFIIDIIAFGNTARMLGRPAYMLLGIDNDDPHNLTGISVMWDYYYAEYTQRAKLAEIEHECNVWEYIKAAISNIITEYITPFINWEFEHGRDPITGKKLAYIKIYPSTDKAFKVSRTSESLGLHKGDEYIRFGESKRKIKPLERKELNRLIFWPYSHEECPFMLPSDWLTYLETLEQKITKERMVNPNKYIEPIFPTGQNIFELVDEFLKDDYSRLLTLVGEAGTGKSVLMIRSLKKIISDSIQIINELINNEEYILPRGIWIPFYFSLCGTSCTRINSLIKTLCQAIGVMVPQKGFASASKITELVSNPLINWVIVLDGFDELGTPTAREKLLSKLSEIIHSYSNIKILLTTRPNCANQDWGRLDGKLIEIPLFNLAQVEQLLLRQVTGTDLSKDKLDKLLKYISENEELCHLLTTPLCLSGVLQELVDTIIDTPSSFKDESETNVRETEAIIPSNTNRTVDEQNIEHGSINSTDQTIEKLPVNITNSLLPESSINVTHDDIIVSQSNNPSDGADTSQILLIPGEDKYQVEEKGEHLPLIGRLLYFIYSDLGTRECKRHFEEDIARWWEQIGPFAVKTNGRHKTFQREDLPSVYKRKSYKALNWILSIGIFREVEKEIGLFRFQTNLTKQYFAAHHILTRRRSNFFEIEKDYKNMTDDFRMQVDHLIQDIETCIVSE